MILNKDNWHWPEDKFLTTAILAGVSYTDAVNEYKRGHNHYQGRWSKHISEAESVANRAIDRLIDHFNMPIDKRVLSWGRSRNRSWGGQWGGNRLGLTLAMKRHVPADHVDDSKTFTFNEYRSFADDPHIGTFNGSWQDCIRVLVAHEYAHALTPHHRHDMVWRKVYKECRAISLK